MKQCYPSGGPYLLFLDFFETDCLQFLFYLFPSFFVVFNIPDISHFVNTILKLYLLIIIIYIFCTF